MSTPVDHEPQEDRQELEEEFAALQIQERRFERRLQNSSIWIAVAAFGAFLISIVALTVAFTNRPGTKTVVMRTPSASTGKAGMPGGSMMGAGAATAGSAANARTVNVQLGEMFVRPNRTTISAGRVTFVARNTGRVTHELMVERVPLKMDGSGRPHEAAAMGMIEDMASDASGKMTLRLKPGTYELFCNVPGHYAAGQHTRFTVT